LLHEQTFVPVLRFHPYVRACESQKSFAFGDLPVFYLKIPPFVEITARAEVPRHLILSSSSPYPKIVDKVNHFFVDYFLDLPGCHSAESRNQILDFGNVTKV
jgi:hypothetical protein